MKKYGILFLFLLISYVNLSAQSDYANINGLGFSFGYAGLRLTDGLISQNEYSGGAVYYDVKWNDFSPKRIVQLETYFNQNNNLDYSASKALYKSFAFIYRHLYFITPTPVISKESKFYLGPGIEVFYQNRKQNSLNLNSDFGFFSLNLNGMQSIPISDVVDIFAQFYLSAFSFAAKSMEGNSLKSESILSFFTFNNFEIEAGCRYKISNLLSASLLYAFHYLRTDSFGYYRQMEDRISIQLEMRF